MNKSDLIAILKEKHSLLTSEQVNELLELTFKNITDALANKKRIEIRGFGSFSPKLKKVQSKFYNSEDKTIKFEEKNTVHFKIGKGFFDHLNS